MKKALILIIFTALTLSLPSCSDIITGNEENTGVIVTPSELEDILDGVGSQNIVSVDGFDDSKPAFYWTENGSVLHSTHTCSSLKNSKIIMRSNYSHAFNKGITQTCSTCFEK